MIRLYPSAGLDGSRPLIFFQLPSLSARLAIGGLLVEVEGAASIADTFGLVDNQLESMMAATALVDHVAVASIIERWQATVTVDFASQVFNQSSAGESSSGVELVGRAITIEGM